MVSLSNHFPQIGFITCSIMSVLICFWLTFGVCWADTTTVCTRFGFPGASYSMVTCAFPSGLMYSRVLSLRSLLRRFVSLCASVIGSGISSLVSLHAYPNIIPWSPAPPGSTPCAISGLCSLILDITAQALSSNPYSALSYPISRMTSLASFGMST